MIFNVRQIKIHCSLLHNNGDIAMVDVTDFRKQVMFNLPVQSTKEKCCKLIMRCKIRCCTHLILCPGFLHLTAIIGYWELCSLNNMSQLEDKSHFQSLGNMQKQKPDQKLPPTYIQYQQWQDNK